MGLRLASFEALQSGGVLEFGSREPGSWQVRLVVPHDEMTTRPAAPSACGSSSSTTTTSCTGGSG